ncbi:MAG: hypothetical protein HQL64_02410 [Magnetococcales bacterium]|nr:hypothetical protein [Magnetococcales bacterium]
MIGVVDQPQQLLLELPLDPVFTLANLVVGKGNRLAVEAVRDFGEEGGIFAVPPFAGLTLCGEAGTGKTHLLQATVRHLRTRHGERAALYLDLEGLDRHLVGDVQSAKSPVQGPEEVSEAILAGFLARFEGCRLVAVDGLDRLDASPPLQEALLYLYNGMKAAGVRLLFAGREQPGHFSTMRDDLRTRLMWGPVLFLEPPDEEDLAAILAKMVQDRQVRISPDLVKFLVNRLPRRVPDVALAIDLLDHAALQQRRPLTIPLAKEVLGL